MNDETNGLIDKAEVTLQRPISYDSNGEKVMAQSVMLYAPNSVQLSNSTFMKQKFFQAVSSVKGESKKEDDGKKISDLSGQDILMMMYMSDVDMVKFMIAAKELLKSGVAKLDDKEKMNATLLEKLSDEDFEKLVGDYLVNFTLASALKKIDSLA